MCDGKASALSGNLVFTIMACQIKWLHSTMFPVSIVVLNLTQSVWICYIKTSALHVITWECEMKKEKVVNEFMYYCI